MLIDRSHRTWAFSTAILFLAATALYVLYARQWPGGPSGRTWPGMAFGVVGSLLMIFAGLIVLRKKTVRWRTGSLSWWLKGHIWLGLLSVPLIFYHAAFRWGGSLEVLLWWTFAAVILSGLLGLALQNFLPRAMQLQLLSEAIPDQMSELTNRLTVAMDSQVNSGCGAAAMGSALARGQGDPAPALSDSKAWLADYYLQNVRPFLGHQLIVSSPLANAQQAEATFDLLRKSLPADCDATLTSLEEACEERRLLNLQQQYHGWLHGWLRVHVPCSIALLVFAILHIISALYY